jgi:hypothetical protein
MIGLRVPTMAQVVAALLRMHESKIYAVAASVIPAQ